MWKGPASLIFLVSNKHNDKKKKQNEIQTLSPGGSSLVVAWIEYAMKQRMAPIHNKMENPPNICLQNLTHSGIVFGGLSWFGPSLSRTSRARADDRPYKLIAIFTLSLSYHFTSVYPGLHAGRTISTRNTPPCSCNNSRAYGDLTLH